MKKILAIVRPEKLERILTALQEKEYDCVCSAGKPLNLPTSVMGVGHLLERFPHDPMKGRDDTGKVLLYPKVTIELIVPETQVEDCCRIICTHARDDRSHGEGKIFISAVEVAINIDEISIETSHKDAA